MDKITKEQFDIIRNNIKSERRRCGYTQDDMAKVLEISKSAYSKLEQGQRTFSLEHLIVISNFLNIELPSLLRLQTSGDAILNQSEDKRKAFLKELLLTFGIGAPPQPEYSMRKISALISFIRAYGHSLPYTPDRLKGPIFYKGYKNRKIATEIEEILSVYEKGIPKEYAEVNELLNQEQQIKKQIAELENKKLTLKKQIVQLEKQIENETSGIISQLRKEIESVKEQLNDKRKAVSKEEGTFYDLSEENRELERIISEKKRTIIKLDKSIKALTTTTPDISTYDGLKTEYERLLKERAELLKELDKTHNRIDTIEEFEPKAFRKNEIEEAIDEYISIHYHNLTSDDIVEIVDNLLLFAQAFAALRRKYKTIKQDPNIYVLSSIHPSDYKNCDFTNISSILKLADKKLDFDIKHGLKLKKDVPAPKQPLF